MNHAETFAAAYAAFTPRADDNPSSVPFYRAWVGLRAAWGADFCDAYNAALHQAACIAQDGDYALALATLRSLADAKTPDEPRYSYSYRTEPQAPTEDDARELFNSEWRAKFPGKRANSKAANAKWLEVADKARAIVRQRFEAFAADYARHEAQLAAENAARRQAWLDKLHAMARLEDAVRAFAD